MANVKVSDSPYEGFCFKHPISSLPLHLLSADDVRSSDPKPWDYRVSTFWCRFPMVEIDLDTDEGVRHACLMLEVYNFRMHEIRVADEARRESERLAAEKSAAKQRKWPGALTESSRWLASNLPSAHLTPRPGPLTSCAAFSSPTHLLSQALSPPALPSLRPSTFLARSAHNLRCLLSAFLPVYLAAVLLPHRCCRVAGPVLTGALISYNATRSPDDEFTPLRGVWDK
ncbi:MAG: hypothetical protein M1812_007769 [Candelaria pacifica]|nr:MAG: hypothetical protein M1812_007769 [Candelaria pacifica]